MYESQYRYFPATTITSSSAKRNNMADRIVNTVAKALSSGPKISMLPAETSAAINATITKLCGEIKYVFLLYCFMDITYMHMMYVSASSTEPKKPLLISPKGRVKPGINPEAWVTTAESKA